MPEESYKQQEQRRRRERQERERRQAERRGQDALARQRIWPAWARTLGAMIEAGAIVRFACGACKRVYDVDVEAMAVLRGREWSLI